MASRRAPMASSAPASTSRSGSTRMRMSHLLLASREESGAPMTCSRHDTPWAAPYLGKKVGGARDRASLPNRRASDQILEAVPYGGIVGVCPQPPPRLRLANPRLEVAATAAAALCLAIGYGLRDSCAIRPAPGELTQLHRADRRGGDRPPRAPPVSHLRPARRSLSNSPEKEPLGGGYNASSRRRERAKRLTTPASTRAGGPGHGAARRRLYRLPTIFPAAPRLLAALPSCAPRRCFDGLNSRAYLCNSGQIYHFTKRPRHFDARPQASGLKQSRDQ